MKFYASLGNARNHAALDRLSIFAGSALRKGAGPRS
jgi:hypothetical protein